MIKLFGRVPRLRSGRATPHYAFASVLRCASHCLTACSVSLTQATSTLIPSIQNVIL
ncbi:MAG: hypothetical protein NZ455_12370 [Bacteroidia bacterium]|nr:hypothetical protein [Bacteroidia bacterium]MDW8346244.1 hypothetical protein [Bacteroidia bacterium]